jgi:hypothetical protein
VEFKVDAKPVSSRLSKMEIEVDIGFKLVLGFEMWNLRPM